MTRDNSSADNGWRDAARDLWQESGDNRGAVAASGEDPPGIRLPNRIHVSRTGRARRLCDPLVYGGFMNAISASLNTPSGWRGSTSALDRCFEFGKSICRSKCLRATTRAPIRVLDRLESPSSRASRKHSLKAHLILERRSRDKLRVCESTFGYHRCHCRLADVMYSCSRRRAYAPRASSSAPARASRVRTVKRSYVYHGW